MYTIPHIRNFYPVLVSFLSTTLPLGVAYAADTFDNPLKEDNLYDFLVLILNAVIYILFPVLILMIVYTGFLFITAQGNESKLTEAKRALVWTIIGGLVLLGAKAIALAIEATIEPLLS